MFRLAKTALCCLAVLSSPAMVSGQSKGQSTGTPSPEVQAQIDVVAKRLCKAEPIVGTRIPVARKCETPSQLRQYQAQAREMIENYRQRTPCLMGMESGDGKAMPC